MEINRVEEEIKHEILQSENWSWATLFSGSRTGSPIGSHGPSRTSRSRKAIKLCYNNLNLNVNVKTKSRNLNLNVNK